jgi:hypothetical protein
MRKQILMILQEKYLTKNFYKQNSDKNKIKRKTLLFPSPCIAQEQKNKQTNKNVYA